MHTVIAWLAGAALATASDSTGYTVADARRDVAQIVQLERGQFGFSVGLDTVTVRSGLGDLARANWHYVYYMIANAPSPPLPAEAWSGPPDAVQRRVVARLTEDSAFLHAIVTSVDRWTTRRTRAHRSVTPRSYPGVSYTRVLTVATRFFYPDAIEPSGRIASHVCVGINGLLDLSGGRDLAVEAFVYAAIFHDLLVPRAGVSDDYDAAHELMNRLDLGTEPAVRLSRAQGVMWSFMEKSTRLGRVLENEYRRASRYLPFVVRGWPRGGA